MKQLKPSSDGKSHFGVRLPNALKPLIKKTAVARDMSVEQFVEAALRHVIEAKARPCRLG